MPKNETPVSEKALPSAKPNGVGSALRRESELVRDKAEIFHCTDVRTMDAKRFIELMRDTVMPSLGSRTGSHGWKSLMPGCALPWANAKVEGTDFVPKDTQRFLNALHTANLLLQKRTEAYQLVVRADDEELQSPDQPVELTGAHGKSKQLWRKIKSDLVPRLWRTLIQASKSGQQKRRKLIQKCRDDPSFMLDFGLICSIVCVCVCMCACVHVCVCT